MANDVKTLLRQQVSEFHRSDVQFDKGALAYVLSPAAREIVDNDDVIAARNEGIGYMRADKPRSASDKDPLAIGHR